MKYAFSLAALIAVLALAVSPAVATGDGGGGGGDWYGYSPGYWKNHLDAWPSGVSPDDQLCQYLRCAPCGTTVLEALRLRGGGQRALMRIGAAAFLNTAYSGDYVLTFGQVHTYFCNGWKYALETWD